MPTIIYCLTFPNGKKYIGQTRLALIDRLKSHKSSRNSDSHPVALAWRTLGEPIATVVAIVANSMALKAERQAIDDFNAEYNVVGTSDSPLIGRKGPHTAEHKAKISASEKGRKFSRQVREKISAGLVRRAARERAENGGIHPGHSAETRAKMAASQALRRKRERQST